MTPTMSGDYKSTVFLPKADFPMKAGLPQREPEWLARWEKIGLWRRLRETARGRDRFILHDGPPYANGNIHIGHALNKILKDVINRTRQMQGFDANYVPGWDCHGLPIEWKIEERYRAGGKDKDEVPVLDFRAECRAFAAEWIDVQRKEFKRLGVLGDWEHPYTTMAFEAEASIVAELGKFVLNGGLFRGFKPVMWSVVEKTSLADAEVEYDDHTSNTVWVRFPVVAASVPELAGADVVIWTTTPWTLPGNRAVAYGKDIDYTVIEVTAVGEGAGVQPGDTLICAESLVADLAAKAGITDHAVKARLKGAALHGTVLAHPLRAAPDVAGGYDFDVPLVEGHHVTTETGTGFVHIAPGHGADDFEIGRKFGIETPETVGPDGRYLDRVPLFAGLHVFKADQPVWEAIAAQGKLAAHGKLTHSYPHSWRSKAPLIFRATPQWFISMTENDLRRKALGGIDATRWVPAQGRNRIRAMVADRPDWCVSRQRAWGVPITVFVSKKDGQPLRDAKVMARIVDAVKTHGADVWFSADPAIFLAPDYDPDDFEQVTDILDVWFDSGSTHAFVLEARDELGAPADLYLEGSDQHRGWFQSSLLESCGTRGRPPYRTVLTHGFINDEHGRKMSKSLGNTTAPQEVCDFYGADILRLWVVASDYTDDLRVGPEIIRYQVDTYRRLRNTLRYLIGALDGFHEAERVAVADMPELERWVLAQLFELDSLIRTCIENYDFHRFYSALHNFCAVDLSAFYFDIRKDALYCDAADSTRRRAARTVMDHIFMCLTAWLAPATCFTAEEAWLARFPSEDDSVHLRQFPDVPGDWRDDTLVRRWQVLRDMRRVVTSALEAERAAKRIGSSLQAAPVVYLDAPLEGWSASDLAAVDWAELFITSSASLREGDPPDGAFTLDDVAGVGVVPSRAEGEKCGRCWKVLDEVGRHQPDDVCGRCAGVLAGSGS
jgi:isoleucyl-tRNA synthetase